MPAALSSFWKVWVIKVHLDEAGTERSFEVRQKGSNNCRALLKVSEQARTQAVFLEDDSGVLQGARRMGSRILVMK